MTDKDLGTAAGDIFAKAFTLGYETGRKYVPAGGMALTAEQVEDVRTVAWYTGAGLSRAPMAEIHRLRALFPATEPAEDASKCTICGVVERAHFNQFDDTHPFTTELGPFDDDGNDRSEPITDLIEKSSLGTESAQALINTVSPERGRRIAKEAARREAGNKVKLTELQRDLLQKIVDQWTKGAGWTHVFWSGTVEALISAGYIVRHEEAFNEYRPTISGEKALAPAEPAEEETKAEDGSGWHWVQSAGGYYSGPACTGGYRCRSMAHYEGCLRPSLPASSPVVPAPTETGPWQTLAEIPASVTRIMDRGHWIWTRIDADEWRCGAITQPSCLAPFVSAKEG